MVGVGESIVDDLPSFLLAEVLLVDEDSQQFDDAESGVGVVELNADLFCELGPLELAVGFLGMAFVTADDVLESSAD